MLLALSIREKVATKVVHCRPRAVAQWADRLPPIPEVGGSKWPNYYIELSTVLKR